MSAANGNGTRTVDPPEGAVPRVGAQAAAKKSVALADEALAAARQIRGRLRELRGEMNALCLEVARLDAIALAAGVEGAPE